MRSCTLCPKQLPASLTMDETLPDYYYMLHVITQSPITKVPNIVILQNSNKFLFNPISIQVSSIARYGIHVTCNGYYLCYDVNMIKKIFNDIRTMNKGKVWFVMRYDEVIGMFAWFSLSR